MGSCRLFGVKWGVERLVKLKPKCVSAEKETALRLGGAIAGSEPYFPTRPSAMPPTSPSGGAPLGSYLGAEPKLCRLAQLGLLPIRLHSRSGPEAQNVQDPSEEQHLRALS